MPYSLGPGHHFPPPHLPPSPVFTPLFAVTVIHGSGREGQSYVNLKSESDSEDGGRGVLGTTLVFCEAKGLTNIWCILTPDALPIGDLLVTQPRHNLPLHTELDLQSVLAALLDNDWGLLQIRQIAWEYVG